MQTDTIENKVEEFNDVARNIGDIKKSYPDEWILLGNPVSDEYDRTISGVEKAMCIFCTLQFLLVSLFYFLITNDKKIFKKSVQIRLISVSPNKLLPFVSI